MFVQKLSKSQKTLKYEVPYYSQHDDIEDPYWQVRTCGIACLKMVLDFQQAVTPNINQFLQIALVQNSFGTSGWIHDKLLILAENYGMIAFRKEFVSLGEGMIFLKDFLQQHGPVIVSLSTRRFSDKFLKSFHQIVLVGYNEKGFFYHDPDYTQQKGSNLFVSFARFEKYWRQLAIFLQKGN